MKHYLVTYSMVFLPSLGPNKSRSVSLDVDVSRCKTADAIMRCIENALRDSIGAATSETVIIQAVYLLK